MIWYQHEQLQLNHFHHTVTRPLALSYFVWSLPNTKQASSFFCHINKSYSAIRNVVNICLNCKSGRFFLQNHTLGNVKCTINWESKPDNYCTEYSNLKWIGVFSFVLMFIHHFYYSFSKKYIYINDTSDKTYILFYIVKSGGGGGSKIYYFFKRHNAIKLDFICIKMKPRKNKKYL